MAHRVRPTAHPLDTPERHRVIAAFIGVNRCHGCYELNI